LNNTNTSNIAVQNNSTDGGGTLEWAKRMMAEQQLQGNKQQFQGGQLSELHEALTTNKKAPSTQCVSRYKAPRNPENQTTAFESNSSSPE
jgi:hypothetical protein